MMRRAAFGTEDVRAPDGDKEFGWPGSTAACTRDECSDGSAHVAVHRVGADVWCPVQGNFDRLWSIAEAPQDDTVGELTGTDVMGA